MEVRMTSQLPERPNLEQLKKQAKALLQAAQVNDPDALERFRVLPAVSGRRALHDAQLVIAREYGFKSWNELREHVEERSLSFTAAVDEFLRCATGSAAARALRLLALHPAIAHASLFTELVLGDASAAEARLRKHPDAATQPGGVQGWEPLLYVCHTCLHRDAPERAEGLVAIARALLASGANPDAQYNFQWHRELPRTALWGALCATAHLPLAEVLLEARANPDDGVSLHINAGGGNLAALELLHRFGVRVEGIPAGVAVLPYILSWAYNATERATGVRWLLVHGANTKLTWGEAEDAPLHIAARRWDVPMTELLVQHGADIHQRRKDGRTAHTLAELHGNRDVAAWLLAHGAKDELSPLERFISACTRGERERADRMLRADPGLRRELRHEHHLMLQIPAERGDAAVLDTMLACGFDANARDGDGVTALHRAAMSGRSGAVRVLLEHGAAVNVLDGMFAGTPLLWASQGWSHNPDTTADYIGTARLLIGAGSSLEWVPPPKAPDPERSQEQLIELCRAAAVAEG
jgi:hypothetical protein